MTTEVGFPTSHCLCTGRTAGRERARSDCFASFRADDAPPLLLSPVRPCIADEAAGGPHPRAVRCFSAYIKAPTRALYAIRRALYLPRQGAALEYCTTLQGKSTAINVDSSSHSEPLYFFRAQARVRAITPAAPAIRRQEAHSDRVAPLVTTSSTRTTRFPDSSAPSLMP